MLLACGRRIDVSHKSTQIIVKQLWVHSSLRTAEAKILQYRVPIPTQTLKKKCIILIKYITTVLLA